MQTIKLKARVGEDGILKLELPPSAKNREYEIVVVLQPLGEVDQLGWPIGFFDRTYGALSDDPIERPRDLPPDVRDDIE